MTNFNAWRTVDEIFFKLFLITSNTCISWHSIGWYEIPIPSNFEAYGFHVVRLKCSLDFFEFYFFFIRVVFNRRNSCFEYLLLQKCKQKPLRWCQLTYKKKIRIKCSTKNYDFFFQAALCAKCLQRHCLPLFRLLIEYLWQGSEHLNLNIDIILASVMRSLFPCLILFYRKQ